MGISITVERQNPNIRISDIAKMGHLLVRFSARSDFRHSGIKNFKHFQFGLLCTKSNKTWFGSLNDSDSGRSIPSENQTFLFGFQTLSEIQTV